MNRSEVLDCIADRTLRRLAARLLCDDHTALVELADELRRRQDFRGEVLWGVIEDAMRQIQDAKLDGAFTVGRWQSLCLLAVRLLAGADEKVASRAP